MTMPKATAEQELIREPEPLLEPDPEPQVEPDLRREPEENLDFDPEPSPVLKEKVNEWAQLYTEQYPDLTDRFASGFSSGEDQEIKEYTYQAVKAATDVCNQIDFANLAERREFTDALALRIVEPIRDYATSHGPGHNAAAIDQELAIMEKGLSRYLGSYQPSVQGLDDHAEYFQERTAAVLDLTNEAPKGLLQRLLGRSSGAGAYYTSPETDQNAAGEAADHANDPLPDYADPRLENSEQWAVSRLEAGLQAAFGQKAAYEITDPPLYYDDRDPELDHKKAVYNSNNYYYAMQELFDRQEFAGPSDRAAAAAQVAHYAAYGEFPQSPEDLEHAASDQRPTGRALYSFKEALTEFLNDSAFTRLRPRDLNHHGAEVTAAFWFEDRAAGGITQEALRDLVEDNCPYTLDRGLLYQAQQENGATFARLGFDPATDVVFSKTPTGQYGGTGPTHWRLQLTPEKQAELLDPASPHYLGPEHREQVEAALTLLGSHIRDTYLAMSQGSAAGFPQRQEDFSAALEAVAADPNAAVRLRRSDIAILPEALRERGDSDAYTASFYQLKDEVKNPALFSAAVNNIRQYHYDISGLPIDDHLRAIQEANPYDTAEDWEADRQARHRAERLARQTAEAAPKFLERAASLIDLDRQLAGY